MEIQGIKDGQAVQVRLDRVFEDAVIAMHLSERHDEQGNPIVIDHTPPNTDELTNRPSVNMSGELGAGLRSSCVEPTSCGQLPVLTEFLVENANGGVRISYDYTVPEGNLC